MAEDQTEKRLPGVEDKRGSPFATLGVPGFVVYNGILKRVEKAASLTGEQRWRTAADILANCSAAAAGLRFFLQLVARCEWKVEPAKLPGEDEPSEEAKKLAEFVQDTLHDMDRGWPRIVRQMAMYRFYGFTVMEWVAKRRPDGKIGFKGIYLRPQHTIEKWDADESGQIVGFGQRKPDRGEQVYLRRNKCIYLVDDTLTDSPEGMGLFRHIAEPWARLKEFQRLELIGLDRDLRGTPVGRAPLTLIREMKEAGALTAEEAEALTTNFENFIKLNAKDDSTALLIDSQVYKDTTDAGEAHSSVPMWAIELLSVAATGLPEIDKAMDRINHEIHRLIGTEVLMVGQGPSGTQSLADNKSVNLFLNVDSTNTNMADDLERQYIDPLWILNGLPDELKPSLVVERAESMTPERIAEILEAMGRAGSPLTPDDDVNNFMRDLIGAPHAPDIDTSEFVGLPQEVPEAQPGGGQGGKQPAQSRNSPEQDEDMKGGQNGNGNNKRN